MDYIKDETVNTFNAQIIPELETPEMRLQVVERVANTMFHTTSSVEFYGLTCFDKHGEDDKYGPTIYWTYIFSVKGQGHRYQTITLDGQGGMDFNFHRLFLSTFNTYMSVK